MVDMVVRRALAVLASVAFFLGSVAELSAADAAGRIEGVVVDQVNGLPIVRASVSLYRASEVVGAPVTSDARGAFSIPNVAPGVYSLLVAATGYETSRSADVFVTPGADVSVNLVVGQAKVSQAGSPRTIGAVSVSSTSALESTTTISRSIQPENVERENGLRLADSLTKLPGVNGEGLSSSVGDDTSLNIRGLGASETVALLDGHPIGPQGVYGINGGGTFPSSFNFADTPLYGLSKVQVTFGSGASGLYGVDAIGGTIDMQTLNPSATPQTTFSQSVGDQGRRQSFATTTGQFGRFGYALAGGVQGTYGLFAPGQVAQTGRPNNNPNLSNNGACTAGNDISACNLALNTYSVSQNTTLRSGLAKLQYGLSRNTTFTTTLFASGSQADSTGNGDNDNIPYATRLAQIDANQTPNCDLPGSAAGSNGGYQVITNQNGGTACDTDAQWAAASSGPYGGGADRNRGTNLADYHFRLQSVSGKNTITADGFHDYYKFYKSSEEAGGLDPTGTQFSGTAYSQYINTNGYLVSDDIVNPDSDIGFGYYGDYQLGTRLNYNVNGLGLYNYDDPETTHYNSGFLRAYYKFTPAFSTFANAWIKHSSVDDTTSFDPRVSLVFRPQASDVVRLTYGHSTGDPAAELKATGPPVLDGNPSSLNPSCTPYNTIGSGGNPSIKPERADDYELGYAHRFAGNSSIQVNLYYTAVSDQLFSASEPLSQFGSVAIPGSLLAGYASKIASAGCAGVDPANPASVLPYLSISTTYNATSATSKGIELVGHQQLTRHLSFDYTYDLQSEVQRGLNTAILQSNPFIIDGGQIQGIPINQADVGIDYANSGLEVRMDGYVVGSNNPKGRPGYNTWDGFVTKAYPHGLSLTFGISNIFDEATQNYGYFGLQQFIPENQYFNDTNSIQQYVNTGSGERYGVPSRSFSFTAQLRV